MSLIMILLMHWATTGSLVCFYWKCFQMTVFFYFSYFSALCWVSVHGSITLFPSSISCSTSMTTISISALVDSFLSPLILSNLYLFFISIFYLSDTINPRYILKLGDCLHFDLIQSRINKITDKCSNRQGAGVNKHHTSEMLAWSKRYQPNSIMVQTINSTKNNNYQY